MEYKLFIVNHQIVLSMETEVISSKQDSFK